MNPERPRDAQQHPGYSKNAAVEAIRRHAFNYLPRDITVIYASNLYSYNALLILVWFFFRRVLDGQMTKRMAEAIGIISTRIFSIPHF